MIATATFDTTSDKPGLVRAACPKRAPRVGLARSSPAAADGKGDVGLDISRLRR